LSSYGFKPMEQPTLQDKTNPVQSMQTSTITPPQVLENDQPATQETPKYITGHSLEEHANALNMAKTKSDAAAIKQITDDYNREYQYQKDIVQTKEAKTKEASDKLEKEQKPNKEVAGVVRVALDRFNNISKDATGPIVGDIATKIPYVSADARQYQKLKEAMAGTLKSLIGETGPLTDYDINRIVGLLPAVNATSEEIELSKKDLKGFLEEKGIPTEGINFGFMDQNNAKDNKNSVLGVESAIQSTTTQPGISVNQAVKSNDQSVVDSLGVAANKATQVMPGFQLFNPESRSAIDKISSFVAGDILNYGKERMDRSKSAEENNNVGEKILNTIESGVPLLQMFNIRNEKGEGVLDDEAAKAATELGLYLITPKILEKAGKVLRPFKTLGDQRSAAAKASEAVINGDDLISKTAQKLQNVSPTDAKAVTNYMQQAEPLYKGKQLNMESALDLLHQANTAFNQSGKVGKSAKAAFNKAFGDVLRGEIESAAPEISKINAKFSKLYKLQDIAKKLILPVGVSIGVGIGTRAGMKATGLGK
jgi:hypothetical protein